MITGQLLKQLKTAGFIQSGKGSFITFNGESLYLPTLDELILASTLFTTPQPNCWTVRTSAGIRYFPALTAAAAVEEQVITNWISVKTK